MAIRKIENKALEIGKPVKTAEYEFGYENEHPTVSLPASILLRGYKTTGSIIFPSLWSFSRRCFHGSFASG